MRIVFSIAPVGITNGCTKKSDKAGKAEIAIHGRAQPRSARTDASDLPAKRNNIANATSKMTDPIISGTLTVPLPDRERTNGSGKTGASEYRANPYALQTRFRIIPIPA